MIILLLLAILCAVLWYRTRQFTKAGKLINVEDLQKDVRVLDEEMQKEINEHLQGAVRIPTVSHNDPKETDWSQFVQFQHYLEETYPGVFKTMSLEKVEGYSLLFKWTGKNKNRKPIAFLSHQDVVPVNAESEWTYPPFSATMADHYIWGRGTFDMKCHLISVMEACERLIREGFEPEEDIYLLFGCNEEVGDQPAGLGADRLSAILEERGIRLDCVIDEGGAITDGSMIGIEPRVCAVGVSEKGFASFDISATQAGGHSSKPPVHTSLGQVCAAAVRLENNWMKPKLIAPVERMLEIVAPYMNNYALRMLMANKWLFKPILPLIFSKVKALKPFVQTTTALTMASGSPQDNVLPQQAHIVMNSRVLPTETVGETLEHVRKVTEGTGVEVEGFKFTEPCPVSPHDTASFGKIRELVEKYYPGTVVIPYVQLGASDSRNYYNICDNIYRIMPFYFPAFVTDLAHCTDERIPDDVLQKGVQLFMDFIREYQGE